jgi:hypothetical protein
MTCKQPGWIVVAAALLGVFALAGGGCGGGGASDAPLPLASERQIKSLSPGERAQLCDWVAGRFGGYGKSIQCNDGRRSARDSQAECLGSLAGNTCPATAGDVETCTDLTLTCASIGTVLLDAACQRLIDCQQ